MKTIPIFRLILLSFIANLSLICAGDFWANKPPVNLDVWDGTIHDAVGQLARQSGFTPLIAGYVSTAKPPRRIFLAAEKMPVEQAVEWLARAGGCRYRVFPDSRVYLTTGYDWLRESRYGVIIRNIETLVGSERRSDRAEKLARFSESIADLMKITGLFEPRYRMRVEEHSDGQIKLNAQVPADLKPLFLQCLNALETAGETPTPPPPLTVSPSEQQLIDKLSSTNVIVSYRDRPLREIIDDLRRQSGLNIGFDYGGELPEKVTMEIGEVNVQTALLTLAKKMNLRSVELSAPNGVWLSGEKRQWRKMPSRRILWVEDLEMRAYSLQTLRDKVDGDVFAHWVRLNVFPEIWQDPLATIFYHAPSGNLLAVAPPDTQRAIAAALCQIRDGR